jgi:uncharacterized protein (TIGR03437 family)
MATWLDSATGKDYAKAIHQDFQSLVTPSSPARPGETIHVYLTGLGPLDQAVPTGAPGPVSPAVHPLAPINCWLENSPGQQLQMPYLGYAAGLIGIYQADLTMPDNLVRGTPTLYCTASDSSGTFSGAALLSTTSEHQ